MLYELIIQCLYSVIRFYENSVTDARGETPGQRISGEAQAVLQRVAHDGRGIDPITDTRLTQRINKGHEL